MMRRPFYGGRFARLSPLLVLVAAGLATSMSALAADEGTAEMRLLSSVRYLASDELEGRGVGTAGLELAAEYLADQFAQLGLDTRSYDGSAFQVFQMTTGAELGKTNQLKLVGPSGPDGPGPEVSLALGEDFMPLALGGSGALDLPLVFVGYGITAPDVGYDDYAGIDVKDKAVVILRHEPQQDDPHSPFDGKRHSPHAPFTRKVSNAFEHGAAAVVFCTDDFEIRNNVARRQKRWLAALDELAAAQAEFKSKAEPTRDELEAHRATVDKLLGEIRDQGEKLAAEFDPVLKFSAGGSGGEARTFPVLHCRRAPLDAMLQASLGVDLATLEKQIDQGPAPRSAGLPGWRLVGEISVQRSEATVKNVVAVLPGSGPLADEVVVVGAHYDHLGRGEEGSLAPDSNEIHNGADDNASGAAALVEVARLLAARPMPLRRTVVFVAFTGEERGLIGSARYVREPLFPLEQTVAMLNMDMVGRLSDDKLILQGTATAAELGPLVDRVNESFGFKISKQPGGFGPSDHSSFYAKKVPALHFFTGTHADYHRPSDDYEKLNLPGMLRISRFVAQLTAELADAQERPTYQQASGGPALGGDGQRPYFGSIPEFGGEQTGYALSGVTKDGPAEKAGLAAGDVIVRLGDSQIGGLEDFDSALRKFKGGDRVKVVVLRGGKEQSFEVVLEPPR